MKHLYTTKDHNPARKILFQSFETERGSKKRKHITSLCTRPRDMAFATCMPQCKFDDQAKSVVRSQKERTENFEVKCLKKIRASSSRNAVTDIDDRGSN